MHTQSSRVQLRPVQEDRPPEYCENDEVNTGKAEPEAIERLRRFLSWCLSVDYHLVHATPDKLNKEDWYHFVQLSIMSSSSEYHTTGSYATGLSLFRWRAGAYANQDICRSLLAPASALGVPHDLLLLMLHMFVQGHSRICRSQMSAITWCAMLNLHLLCWKMALDRQVLFDAVLPNDSALRRRFEAAHYWSFRGYFYKNRLCNAADQYAHLLNYYEGLRARDLTGLPHLTTHEMIQAERQRMGSNNVDRLPLVSGRRLTDQITGDWTMAGSYWWISVMKEVFEQHDNKGRAGVGYWKSRWVMWRQKVLFSQSDKPRLRERCSSPFFPW